MSIAVLTQVYDEMRRLAIAGSDLAGGDFRLKKLLPPLEASAAKAPVFGKVAEAIQKLVGSDSDSTGNSSRNSAQALLELSTLVSAILYTQGETGADGELQPIETVDFGLPASNTSARLLKPLIEALTTTGSGREELIRDAYDRGAFKDLRLVRVAVGAIDDPYPAIADFIADRVLPMYGNAIYDDLRSAFDPKAKGGQVRRLRLMHRLDPARTHELVEQALESGSPDMKVAAIQCLEGREEAISYLLEQSKSKSSDVRRAALRAMSGFTSDEVVGALIKSLSGADLELGAESASRNRSPQVLKYLLKEGEQRLDELFSIKDVATAGTAIKRFYHLCGCFASRDDKQTIAFLTRCFERRDDIAQLKGADGRHINHRVASLLVRSNDKSSLKKLIEAHATLLPEVLEWAFFAAVRSRKPKEVYDLFSPYYLVKVAPKKKRSDSAGQKRETIRAVLAAHCGGYGYGSGFSRTTDYATTTDLITRDEFSLKTEWDLRWLDAAIESEDLELVQMLARPKHKGVLAFLSRVVDGMLNKNRDLEHDAVVLLETMIRIEHPQAVEQYLAALRKVGSDKRQYYSYWIARVIPSLPKAAAPKIEELVPSLNEQLVDQIAPYLVELKGKSS